jgi:3-oxoacyl-[acyl-carrier-protein] synthase II
VTTPVAITGAGERLGTDDPLAGLPEPVRARGQRAERVTALALGAVAAALRGAGLAALDGPPRPRLGIVLGTAFGCFLTNAAYQRRLAEGGPAAASPRLFAATVSNAAAGEVSIAYRLGGPALTVTAGGASGLLAVGEATDLLRAARADALVAGGMDAGGEALDRWCAAAGLAPARSFAGAAAVVVIERLAAVVARGARVLGTVEGHASAFEPDPTGPDAGRALGVAIARALADAGITPDDLCLFVPAARDGRALARALAGVLPRTSRSGATLGETFGAAGPVALLATLDALREGELGLVVDVCPTGHVGALVVRRGGIV